MAAIVTKFAGFGRGRVAKVKTAQPSGSPDRKGRAARVSAKAAKRANHEDGEPELDAEALAGDDDAEGTEAAELAAEKAAKKARPDNGTYLSMYFRDMAALDVLRPEEEFTSAREIEALEIMLWETVLAHGPAISHLVEAIELVIEALPPEVKALRSAVASLPAEARSAAKQRGESIDKPDAKTWTKLVTRAAKKLRTDDVDHVFIDAALITVDRISVGIGVRGAELGSLGRERARAEWLRRVYAANRAAAEARNDFVRANLRLVVSIARRFNHGRMALADLIQEGNLGLLKAVERYDYRRGFRFSTYASWWIRHAISRALADKGREVRLPVHMIDAQHRLTKARRQLTGKLGRQPTSEELAEATQMPVDKIEKMRSWLLEQSISIDKPVGDDEGRVLGEILEDPDREDVSPTGELEWEALTTEVRDLLTELRPIEADILRQRFGLGTEQELTLKEIGDKYNLSRERIRQLQEQALAKMRRALARRDLM